MSKSRRTPDEPPEDGTEADAPERPEITFRRSGELILGLCGPQGYDGIYCFLLGSGSDWTFLPYGTKAWDEQQQQVFVAMRCSACDDPWALDRLVPPLPESFPPPERYIKRDPPEPEAPHAKRGSPVFERVAAAPGSRLRVCVVLLEDLYESQYGDGIFRYFSAGFFDEGAARAYIAREMEAASPEGRKFKRFHRRAVELEVQDDTLVFDEEGTERGPFDHFDLKQVTDSLAESVGE